MLKKKNIRFLSFYMPLRMFIIKTSSFFLSFSASVKIQLNRNSLSRRVLMVSRSLAAFSSFGFAQDDTMFLAASRMSDSRLGVWGTKTVEFGGWKGRAVVVVRAWWQVLRLRSRKVRGCFAQDDRFWVVWAVATATTTTAVVVRGGILAEQELLVAEGFDGVAEFGGFFVLRLRSG